jgi:hypothetical protein
MTEDQEGTFRDHISTIDETGKRKWVSPKKPKGKFFNYRQLTSYSLLALLFTIPHIKVNGDPFLLLNVVERKFIRDSYNTPSKFNIRVKIL